MGGEGGRGNWKVMVFFIYLLYILYSLILYAKYWSRLKYITIFLANTFPALYHLTVPALAPTPSSKRASMNILLVECRGRPNNVMRVRVTARATQADTAVGAITAGKLGPDGVVILRGAVALRDVAALRGLAALRGEVALRGVVILRGVVALSGRCGPEGRCGP